jgi:hypothetical protein
MQLKCAVEGVVEAYDEIVRKAATEAAAERSQLEASLTAANERADEWEVECAVRSEALSTAEAAASASASAAAAEHAQLASALRDETAAETERAESLSEQLTALGEEHEKVKDELAMLIDRRDNSSGACRSCARAVPCAEVSCAVPCCPRSSPPSAHAHARAANQRPAEAPMSPPLVRYVLTCLRVHLLRVRRVAVRLEELEGSLEKLKVSQARAEARTSTLEDRLQTSESDWQRLLGETLEIAVLGGQKSGAAARRGVGGGRAGVGAGKQKAPLKTVGTLPAVRNAIAQHTSPGVQLKYAVEGVVEAYEDAMARAAAESSYERGTFPRLTQCPRSAFSAQPVGSAGLTQCRPSHGSQCPVSSLPRLTQCTIQCPVPTDGVALCVPQASSSRRCRWPTKRTARLRRCGPRWCKRTRTSRVRCGRRRRWWPRRLSASRRPQRCAYVARDERTLSHSHTRVAGTPRRMCCRGTYHRDKRSEDSTLPRYSTHNK